MKDLMITAATASFDYVTPERAAFMLTSNVDNYRRLNRKHINNLKNELMLGEWVATTQGIGFDTNGVLVDGQHRLTAIVESGVTAQLLVCYNLQPDSKLKVDVGRKRSMTDLTGLSGTVIATVRKPQVCPIVVVVLLIKWNRINRYHFPCFAFGWVLSKLRIWNI